MLTDTEIRKRELIGDASTSNFRPASYDLRIGMLINPSGEIVESYKVPPQGIVEVISEETVNVNSP